MDGPTRPCAGGRGHPARYLQLQREARHPERTGHGHGHRRQLASQGCKSADDRISGSKKEPPHGAYQLGAEKTAGVRLRKSTALVQLYLVTQEPFDALHGCGTVEIDEHGRGLHPKDSLTLVSMMAHH